MTVGKLTDIRMNEPEPDDYAIVMDIWELEDLEEVLSEVMNYGSMFDTDKIKKVQKALSNYVEELTN